MFESRLGRRDQCLGRKIYNSSHLIVSVMTTNMRLHRSEDMVDALSSVNKDDEVTIEYGGEKVNARVTQVDGGTVVLGQPGSVRYRMVDVESLRVRKLTEEPSNPTRVVGEVEALYVWKP